MAGYILKKERYILLASSPSTKLLILVLSGIYSWSVLLRISTFFLQSFYLFLHKFPITFVNIFNMFKFQFNSHLISQTFQYLFQPRELPCDFKCEKAKKCICNLAIATKKHTWYLKWRVFFLVILMFAPLKWTRYGCPSGFWFTNGTLHSPLAKDYYQKARDQCQLITLAAPKISFIPVIQNEGNH